MRFHLLVLLDALLAIGGVAGSAILLILHSTNQIDLLTRNTYIVASFAPAAAVFVVAILIVIGTIFAAAIETAIAGAQAIANHQPKSPVDITHHNN